MGTEEEKYPLALKKGTVLAGQYIIDKVLGQGGFGITYRAEDHKTGGKVAIKEFFPDTLATRTEATTVMPHSGERGESFKYGIACFLQEAETLAQFVGNESIVKIHTYFEENGTAYFVMDYVEGESFDDYIKRNGGKIPYEDAERILLPIIEALAVVHSKGIVHRDVTPDNIFITKDGKVKLLDFGAARYSIGDKSRSLDVVLKHGFAPKEQYTRHGKQGPFTDVYTVGASFYYAITGKRPMDSIDRLEVDDLVPPSSLGVQLPEKKEEAILKAMGVQPNERFQTMGEFKEALVGNDTSDAKETQESTPASMEQKPETNPAGNNPTATQAEQTTTNTANAAPVKKKKKWVIPVVIAAIVVVLGIVGIGVVGLVGGGGILAIALGNSNNYGTFDQQTRNNISGGVGYCTDISEGYLYTTDDSIMLDGNVVKYTGSTNMSFWEYKKGYIAYVSSNTAYYTSLDGKDSGILEELSAYSGDVFKIWMNNKGVFALIKQGSVYQLVYVKKNSTRAIEGPMVDGGANCYMLEDSFVYEDRDVVYQIKFKDFKKGKSNIIFNESGLTIKSITGYGNTIYISAVTSDEGDALYEMDMTTLKSNLIGVEYFNANWHVDRAVCDENYYYFVIFNNQAFNSELHKVRRGSRYNESEQMINDKNSYYIHLNLSAQNGTIMVTCLTGDMEFIVGEVDLDDYTVELVFDKTY